MGTTERTFRGQLQVNYLLEYRRKERERVKKEIMSGTNFLGEKHEFQIFSNNESNWFTKCYETIGQFFNWFIPLSSDIEYIQSRYDQTISGFLDRKSVV